MTAVLQATDVLRKDRMASLDDSSVNYPSTPADWKAKYMEVADMLTETRQELDDFHHSSKELEEELERELERTEKAQQDLKVKVARGEQERDEWKSKFMSLQTTHNTTTASLQRELDTLRQDHQKVKIQLRELEMGNDDLERNERAISSSLADAEAKYSRALEEKILLEHELLDKATVEEECQRLKDQLRDANEEIQILKDQIATVQSATATVSASHPSSTLGQPTPPIVVARSEDNLLSIAAPSDLQLMNLSHGLNGPPDDAASESSYDEPIFSTPVAGRMSNRLRPALSTPPSAISSSLLRSTTVPGISTPSRLQPRAQVARPVPVRNPSATSSTNTAGGAPTSVAKSKGVQMVSEMRARVRVLEQKIHTRVPRLRMGSTATRPNPSPMPPPPLPKAGPSTAASSPAPSTSSRGTSLDERTNLMKSRRSVERSIEGKKTPANDKSGWVLIMEDTPSPLKNKDKEKRRISSPAAPAPSSFRPIAPESPTTSIPRAPSAQSNHLGQSAIRRPQSRLSVSTEGRSSVSTIATTSTSSSIPTPTSRPSTPTFLPLPSSGLYSGGGSNPKRSTGPESGAYSGLKRSSFGSSIAMSRSPVMPSPSRSHANVTVRPIAKIVVPNSLSTSRIGRPGGAAARRSLGDAANAMDGEPRGADKGRFRSGSASATRNLS